jgi:hypothetical protein
MSHDISVAAGQPQLLPLQRLADARRILEITCEGHPFMDAEGRAAIRDGKRMAWAVLAEVTEQLVETLNVAAGDPDLEDDDPAEHDGTEYDAAWTERSDQSKTPPTGFTAYHEDAEDDDADDTGNAEDEGLSGGALQYAARDNGAGCVIVDPDAAVDDSCCDEPTQDLEPEDGF